MEKYRILYIDDEEANLMLFEAMFQREYELLLASSANEGLKILAQQGVDAIISDERMPGKTGTDLFIEVKDLYPDIPRILLTTHGTVETLAKAINEAEITKFISKPILKEQVDKVIKNALEPLILKRQNEILTQELRSAKILYENSFNQAAIGFAHIDFEGNTLRVNNKILEYYGYQKDDLLGKPFTNIVLPDETGEVSGLAKKIREGSLAVTHFKLNFKHKKGHTVYTSINLTAQRNKENKPIFYVATVIDISSKIKIEREMQTQSDLLQSILDYSQNYIFIKDAAGKFILVNNKFCQGLDKTKEEILGKTESELHQKDQSIDYNLSHQQVIEQKQELELISKDIYKGKDRYSITHKYPLINNKGEVWAVGGISTDISELKEAQLKVEKNNELLEQRVARRTKKLKDFNLQLRIKQEREVYLKNLALDLGTCQAPQEVQEKVTRGLLQNPRVITSQCYEITGDDKIIETPKYEFHSENHPKLKDETYLKLQKENIAVLKKVLNENQWHEISIGETSNGEKIWSLSIPIIEKINSKAIFTCYVNETHAKNSGFSSFVSQFQNQLHQACERLKFTQQLIDSETNFKEFSDKLPVAIFEANLNGQITYINKKGYEWNGYSPDDVEKGMSVFDLIIDEDHELVHENITKLSKGVTMANREYTLKRKNGDRAAVLFTSSIIYKNNQPVGMRGISIDISDMKRSLEEMEAFNETMVHREMRIIELKEEINALCKANHLPLVYEPVWDNINEN